MKIFGIGWAKTGTTTLKQCFEILGYTHEGYRPDLCGDIPRVLRIARGFETFQDLPWYLYYKELDRVFPGSKFVLTHRDSRRWVRSYLNDLSKQRPRPRRKKELESIRQRLYGLPCPEDKDAQQLIEHYELHYSEVARHFRDRPEDILCVNWEDGDGWGELCKFLDLPLPVAEFPHANKGDYS